MSSQRAQPVKRNTNPSRMNGDNLLQLKYLRQAEQSPRVLSYNTATRVQMIRQINWGYREQALNIEKAKKGQYIYYKQLKRLQQEKRSLQQQSYKHRQEEAKMDVIHEIRDRKIRKVLDNYEEKSREIIADILDTTRKRRRRPVEDDLENGKFEIEGQGRTDGQGEEGEGQTRERKENNLEGSGDQSNIEITNEMGGRGLTLGTRQSEDEGQRQDQGQVKGDEADAEETEIKEQKNEDLVSQVQQEMQELASQDAAIDGLTPVPPQRQLKFRHVWKPADAEKYSERRGSVYIEYMYVKPGVSTLTLEALEEPDVENRTKRRRSRTDSLTGDHHSWVRRQSLRRRSKALAVNPNDLDEPRTVLKSPSNCDELPPLKTVKNRTREPPPKSVLVENFHENGVDEIVAVETANHHADVETSDHDSLKVMPMGRTSKQFRGLPVISENHALEIQHHEEDVDRPTTPVHNVTQLIIISPREEEAVSQGASSSSSSQKSVNVKKNLISNVDYIKQRQLEREAEKQKVLDLPYTAYTMDKDGAVVPMLGLPKPMNTDPPTNIEKYKRDKLLVKQLAKQRDQNETLKEFLEKIHRDVEAMPPPPNPNPEISVETMAKLIEQGDFKDEEKVKDDTNLPINIQTIFLRNKFDEIPDDLDPNSMEALAKCKYLREFDAEAAKEAKKAGRRASSWQVNTQTVGGVPQRN